MADESLLIVQCENKRTCVDSSTNCNHLPKPINKCIPRGEFTNNLREVFDEHCHGNGALKRQQIRCTLNEMGLFPSRSQMFEMTQCACECSGRKPENHLVFGEFCFIVAELQEQYRKGHACPSPRSLLRKKRTKIEENRARRRLPVHMANFTVFLGGACNPTTWRHDIAIPFLKTHGITFYNPQVSNWKPELVEVEDQAKQSADLLFFVVDNITRSTASMVEAAYIAGCGRQLILVIKDFPDTPLYVADEKLTEVERQDLERSHTYLTDLVERLGIPVFGDLDTALHCTAKVVSQGIKVQDLTLEDGAHPVKNSHIRVGHKLIKLKEAFDSVDTKECGIIDQKDLALAYRCVTNTPLEGALLTTCKQQTGFNFEDFCCLVAEHKQKKKSLMGKLANIVLSVPRKLIGWVHERPNSDSEDELRCRDVFLGGSCGDTTWREEIAIPMLRKEGLSFFNPHFPEWSMRHLPMEAAVKDSCCLLLYVITGDTRAMTTMLEVGHFVGLGCNVVLCVQNIEEGVIIEGEQLTPYAVKDYNRARLYLADVANREAVPVFEHIKEAVICCIQKLNKS